MTRTVPAKLFIFTFAIITLWSNLAFSGDMYWVNGSGDWNDGDHWSNSSGGAPSGTVPGVHDDVIFDTHSFIFDFSLVHLTSNVSINSMLIESDEYISFHGSDMNLTLSGDLTIYSKAGFQLGGKLIFKNPNPLPATIQTNGNDFNTDIFFDEGEWRLDGHLKTGQNYTVCFNEGTFRSRGYTVHTRAIYASNSNVALD